ncbi:MAG: hypothetical protein AAGF60_03120 [Pseudomonadota bacterium]
MKRFVQGLLIGVAGFALVILIGIPGVSPGALARMDRAGVDAWKAARASFTGDVAARACATQDHVRAAADARGWDVETVIVGSEPLPERLSTARYALRIHTRPPLPFAKDPGDVEGFDAAGCLIR